MRTITAKPYNHTPWKFMSHFLLESSGIRIEVSTLYYPGHPLHMKDIFKEYKTKRYADGSWGRQRISYATDDDKKSFPRLSDLIKHHSKQPA